VVSARNSRRGRMRLRGERKKGQRGREHCGNEQAAHHHAGHGQRPHSMASGSATGPASARSVTVQSPDVAAQVAEKVHGGLLVFWIVTLPLVSEMIAVSPGCVSWMHW